MRNHNNSKKPTLPDFASLSSAKLPSHSGANNGEASAIPTNHPSNTSQNPFLLDSPCPPESKHIMGSPAEPVSANKTTGFVCYSALNLTLQHHYCQKHNNNFKAHHPHHHSHYHQHHPLVHVHPSHHPLYGNVCHKPLFVPSVFRPCCLVNGVAGCNSKMNSIRSYVDPVGCYLPSMRHEAANFPFAQHRNVHNVGSEKKGDVAHSFNFDDKMRQILETVAKELRLSETERYDLYYDVWKNYLRTFPCLKMAYETGRLDRILHPVLVSVLEPLICSPLANVHQAGVLAKQATAKDARRDGVSCKVSHRNLATNNSTTLEQRVAPSLVPASAIPSSQSSVSNKFSDSVPAASSESKSTAKNYKANAPASQPPSLAFSKEISIPSPDRPVVLERFTVTKKITSIKQRKMSPYSTLTRKTAKRPVAVGIERSGNRKEVPQAKAPLVSSSALDPLDMDFSRPQQESSSKEKPRDIDSEKQTPTSSTPTPSAADSEAKPSKRDAMKKTILPLQKLSTEIPIAPPRIKTKLFTPTITAYGEWRLENVEAPHLDPAARPEILVKAEQNVRAVTILNCGNVSVEAFLDIKNVRLVSSESLSFTVTNVLESISLFNCSNVQIKVNGLCLDFDLKHCKDVTFTLSDESRYAMFTTYLCANIRACASHVSDAGRLLPDDPPLSLTLPETFVFQWDGEKRRFFVRPEPTKSSAAGLTSQGSSELKHSFEGRPSSFHSKSSSDKESTTSEVSFSDSTEQNWRRKINEIPFASPPHLETTTNTFSDPFISPLIITLHDEGDESDGNSIRTPSLKKEFSSSFLSLTSDALGRGSNAAFKTYTPVNREDLNLTNGGATSPDSLFRKVEKQQRETKITESGKHSFESETHIGQQANDKGDLSKIVEAPLLSYTLHPLKDVPAPVPLSKKTTQTPKQKVGSAPASSISKEQNHQRDVLREKNMEKEVVSDASVPSEERLRPPSTTSAVGVRELSTPESYLQNPHTSLNYQSPLSNVAGVAAQIRLNDQQPSPNLPIRDDSFEKLTFEDARANPSKKTAKDFAAFAKQTPTAKLVSSMKQLIVKQSTALASKKPVTVTPLEQDEPKNESLMSKSSVQLSEKTPSTVVENLDKEPKKPLGLLEKAAKKSIITKPLVHGFLTAATQSPNVVEEVINQKSSMPGVKAAPSAAVPFKQIPPAVVSLSMQQVSKADGNESQTVVGEDVSLGSYPIKKLGLAPKKFTTKKPPNVPASVKDSGKPEVQLDTVSVAQTTPSVASRTTDTTVPFSFAKPAVQESQGESCGSQAAIKNAPFLVNSLKSTPKLTLKKPPTEKVKQKCETVEEALTLTSKSSVFREVQTPDAEKAGKVSRSCNALIETNKPSSVSATDESGGLDLMEVKNAQADTTTKQSNSLLLKSSTVAPKKAIHVLKAALPPPRSANLAAKVSACESALQQEAENVPENTDEQPTGVKELALPNFAAENTSVQRLKKSVLLSKKLLPVREEKVESKISFLDKLDDDDRNLSESHINQLSIPSASGTPEDEMQKDVALPSEQADQQVPTKITDVKTENVNVSKEPPAFLKPRAPTLGETLHELDAAVSSSSASAHSPAVQTVKAVVKVLPKPPQLKAGFVPFASPTQLAKSGSENAVENFQPSSKLTKPPPFLQKLPLKTAKFQKSVGAKDAKTAQLTGSTKASPPVLPLSFVSDQLSMAAEGHTTVAVLDVQPEGNSQSSGGLDASPRDHTSTSSSSVSSTTTQNEEFSSSQLVSSSHDTSSNIMLSKAGNADAQLPRPALPKTQSHVSPAGSLSSSDSVAAGVYPGLVAARVETKESLSSTDSCILAKHRVKEQPFVSSDGFDRLFKAEESGTLSPSAVEDKEMSAYASESSVDE